MRAADIMTTNIFMIDSLATVAEAIAKMQDNKVRSSILQPSVDNAYKIVTETDIIYKVATKDVDPESVLVYQIMTKPCIVVNPDLESSQTTDREVCDLLDRQNCQHFVEYC